MAIKETKKIEGLLDKQSVKGMLLISDSGLYNLAKKGVLSPRIVGGRTYYLEQEIKDFIANPPFSRMCAKAS